MKPQTKDTKMRMKIAKAIWKLHDWLDDPLNRLGCRIAWGKNWRTEHDPK